MTGPKTPKNDDEERRLIGERLRTAREYLGLTQDEVARHVGIPRTALTNLENGLRKFDALELKELAKLFDRPVAYFTTSSETESGPPSAVTHLARTAAQLSSKDLDELTQFAQFLQAKSEARGPKK